MNIKKITRQAIISAIYVVMTISLGDLSFGPLQFRISEIMAILPFFNPEYILGITLGVFIANMTSTLGVFDMFLGSFASFVVAYLMSKMKNFYIACLLPIIGMVVVAFEIYIFIPNVGSFFVLLLQLMMSEFIVVYLIGVPIFYALNKNKNMRELLEFKKEI